MFFKAIAALVLFLVGVGVAGFLFARKKLKSGATAAILLVLVGVYVAVLAIPAGRQYLNIPVGTAGDTASRFCDAFSEKDEETAHQLLREDSLFSAPSDSQSEAAAHLLRQLVAGIRVEPVGETEMGWFSAGQKIAVTFPNISECRQEICAKATDLLQAIGAERPRSLVYTPDKTFLPEVVEEAVLSAALDTGFENCGELSGETALTLVCENGEWKVQSDGPVYRTVADALGGETLSAVIDGLLQEAADGAASAPYVEKHFSIPFEKTVAPAPDPARYGATTDPAEVSAVIESCSELLQGQQTAWNPEIEIYPGTQINYYCDDSILAIVWREERENTLCTFAEIKVADASQLRRKLVDDMFDPPTSDWIEATRLSEEVNAVVATGSDLYAFRDSGIFSHDGILYRCNPAHQDSCHITRSGDMLFTHQRELSRWDDAQQWITDNDIMYSISFGPVLIENGEPVITWDYPVGEIWEGYSRAAMGQLGEKGSLHYLMLVMASDERVSVPEKPVFRNPILSGLLKAMIDKGCTQAYTLDGGQTGAIIINNEMITRPTYGWERIYCDILYFATAIPPEERLG